MNKKIESILNRQVVREGYSSHLYLAMASWAENEGYKGIASWLYAQAEEERLHMLKFIKYINERGGKAIIPEIEKPPVRYAGVLKMFEEVLKHEQFITGSINEIVQTCMQEKDFNTYQWVQWFVNEQLEEEASVRTLLDSLRLAGDQHLYLFDRDIMSMRLKEKSADTAAE
ncbi:MAG: ferritin [Bacteroidales bacterium]|nr:ferritin [Bacteroidales bacterium]